MILVREANEIYDILALKENQNLSKQEQIKLIARKLHTIRVEAHELGFNSGVKKCQNVLKDLN